MAINTSNISSNSNQVFGIINQAQQTTNDQSEKIAKLNTETKIKNDAEINKGKVIDIVV